ncbi:MAG: M48 family metalloprotease [Clostridia bacterium]|nr:M48 family metalloprotease [Clostridia bacterium]
MNYRRLASYAAHALLGLVAALLAAAVYEVKIRSIIPKGGVCPNCSLLLPQLLFLALVLALGTSFVLTLFRLVLGAWLTRDLQRGLAAEGAAGEIGAGLAARLDRLAVAGLIRAEERRRLHVLDRPTAPEAFSAGFWKPQVYLSPSLVRLGDAQLLAVLRHELDHVRHRDPFHRLLEKALQQSFPYLPLLGLMGERLEQLREIAADQAALAAGSHPADLLEALAELLARPSGLAEGPLERAAYLSPFARRGPLGEPWQDLRLWHLLQAGTRDGTRNLSACWLHTTASLLLAGVAALLPLAAVLLIRCTTFAAWFG